MRCRLRCPNQIADYRLSFSHGSGLVQYHRINLLGGFQAFGVFYQNAPFRTFADAYHDGGGCGKPQGTWAGDDKYRNQRQQSVCKAVLPVQQHPCDERQHGNADNNRHEDARNLVCQLLDGGFAALRILHHVDDFSEQRIRPYFLRAEPETPFLVDSAGKDFGVLLLGYCYRFTAQHAFVHIRTAFRNDAVHGNPFSRFH